MQELIKDIFTINYYEKRKTAQLCDLEDLKKLINLYEGINFEQINMLKPVEI